MLHACRAAPQRAGRWAQSKWAFTKPLSPSSVETLHVRRAAPRRALADKVRMALGVAQGMQALEAADPPILHRDLKPRRAARMARELPDTCVLCMRTFVLETKLWILLLQVIGVHILFKLLIMAQQCAAGCGGRAARGGHGPRAAAHARQRRRAHGRDWCACVVSVSSSALCTTSCAPA